MINNIALAKNITQPKYVFTYFYLFLSLTIVLLWLNDKLGNIFSNIGVCVFF